MTSDTELEPRVRALLAQTIEASSGHSVRLEPDTPLLDEGLLDSLTVLQVFTAIEETFGVELEPTDLTEETFATPSAVAALVAERA